MFRNSTRPLGIALMVAALLPLSHGSSLFSAQNDFIDQSSKKHAFVIEHAQKPATPGSRSGNEVYSVVEFTDDHGIRQIAQANIASYPPAHDIGDEISIRVHHTAKSDVRIDSFTGLWFESVFYLLPGALTFLGGAFMFFRRRQRTLPT